MRIKADERKRRLKEVQEYERSDKHSQKETQKYNDNWWTLKIDHYSDLRLKIDHITRLPLLDALQKDVLEGTGAPVMKDYMQHYDEFELGSILSRIRSAKNTLEWLEGIAEDELQKRRRGKIVLFKR